MKKAALILGAGLVVGLYAGVAAAEVPTRGLSVADRARPDFDPIGVKVGAFKFLPKASVDGQYNTNIYATQNGAKSDYITDLTADARLVSDWSRHSLDTDLNVKSGLYSNNTDEDFTDLTASVNSRIDVTRDARLVAGGSVARNHEDRSSPDNANGIDPTKYMQYNGTTGGDVDLGRFNVKVTGDYSGYRYNNVTKADGSRVDNVIRNRNEYDTKTRVSYMFLPKLAAFVDGSYNWRRYTQTGANRDSQGYRVNGGSAFDLGGLLSGEAYAGYLSQDFKDVTARDVSGVNYGASLLWNASGLTSVGLDLNREVGETTTAGASGLLTTSAGLKIDHELQRNVIVNAHTSYAFSKYEGVTREDNVYGAGASGKYLINRMLSAELGYDFTKRDSKNIVGQDYDRSVVMFKITGKY